MSLLMVRKSFPAHAADAHIDDIAYKYKVGDKIKTPDGVGTVQKKTHTNSGKPAYEVKLDKGGIVVHVEQSVSAANDAQDANGDEVIAQKNGYKLVHNTLNDGYWFYTKSGAGWGITATNKVAAVNEFNRLVDSAKDAAEFKVGDLVRMNEGGLTGKITKIEPNGHFRVSFLYNRANGFSQSFSANEIVMVKPAKDSAAGAAQDAYIAFPTPPAHGKPFPHEARIIEKLKKEMMDLASHVEDAAHHFDFVANVNKSGNTLEEQELYDFYRAWEHKCDSIRSALH